MSVFFMYMTRRPPRSTPLFSSEASDVDKGQTLWVVAAGKIPLKGLSLKELPEEPSALKPYF